MASEMITLEAPVVRDLVARLFRAVGVDQDGAEISARCLVRADLRGVDTHGIVRMPNYLTRIADGLVAQSPALEPEFVGASVARLDGGNGLGFVVATKAVDCAIDMAGKTGLGLVGVLNSSHYGMGATYLLQAIEAGFAAMVFTNSAPAMPPWGGRGEMFGTSPFAVGVPSPNSVPFVLDMSPTVVARGKIRKAEREGRPIPEGWALDANGASTTNPTEALESGSLLPIGAHKGSGMSMMLDILCGVLTGASFAGDVGDQYKQHDRPQGVGHFVLVMKPDLFMLAEDIAARMAHLVDTVKACPKAAGIAEIFLPGEQEQNLETQRLVEGIPYRVADLVPLVQAARQLGVELPDALDRAVSS